MTQDAHVAAVAAREAFLALVATLRPELHRYCARLTGSVIDGEDVVQETLAKALYALGMNPEVPPLRPWLFRIAHNTALDVLRSHGHRLTEPHPDLEPFLEAEAPPDPLVTRLALARFLTLPVIQRSAVILKDVLGHSLEETAETMDTTVPAVKAALVRGRRALVASQGAAVPPSEVPRAALERYAALFNARDWDGLRALLGEDCRLELVSKAQRRGEAVGQYFGQYARVQVDLQPVRLEGRLALAARVDGAARPTYFILLEWAGARVGVIRDYRYVPYIAAEADYEALA
jgi:RNA polymerase sigma factor (sigma-70 family)